MAGGGAQLRLLGAPEVRQGEAALALRRKERALLAFLAAARRPASRSSLALLLCPLAADPAATLRILLTRIRSQLSAAILRLDGDTVALNPTALWVDLLAFERLLTAPSVGAATEQLAAAADLYRGPFLDGLALGDAPEFELWMLGERTRLQQRYEQTLQTLITLAQERNDLHEAIRRGRQLVQVNPLLEQAHAQLIRLYAQAGQHEAAMAQFAACRDLLAVELGAAPDPELVKLIEAIRSGAWRPRQPALVADDEDRPTLQLDLVRHNLPAALTSFVGREEERAQLAALLADSNCRLLTLTGPGGVGKTRLALTVAREQLGPEPFFRDGVFLITLAALRPAGVDLPDVEPLAATIAAALKLPLTGAAPAEEQLLGALADKAMLLILDNFEHLVATAGFLDSILTRAPQVKLLVTSRESLKLYGEWVYALDGLPFPSADTDEDRAIYPSMELFAERALLADRRFDLAGEISYVARICRSLAGMPLGIELAAAWAHTLGCAALAHAIDESLDILSTEIRNLPDRHRSLRAAFDYSWRLLAPNERVSFARLTIFSGGFTAEAAAKVAAVEPEMLNRLVDVSLVQRGAANRYTIHELLRQFGAEQLQDGPALRARHIVYFAGLARAHEQRLAHGDPAAVAVIEADMDNLRVAWHAAIEPIDEAALNNLLDALATICELRGWLTEGHDSLSHALVALGSRPSEAGELLAGRLELRLAGFCEQLARYDTARAHAEAAAAIFARVGAPALEARATMIQGQIHHALGDNTEAIRLLERSLHTFRELGHRAGQAEALYHLSFPYVWADNGSGMADRCVAESLSLAEELGDLRGMARCHYILGNNCIGVGDNLRALEHYAASLRLSRQIGDVTGMANCLKNQGMAAQSLGRLDEAGRYVRDGLKLFTRIGDRRGVANSLYDLGAMAIKQADYATAQSYLEQSLALYKEIRRPLAEAIVLGSLGDLFAIMGDDNRAADLLRESLALSIGARSAIVTFRMLPAAAVLIQRRGETNLAIKALAHCAASPAAEASPRDRAEEELQRLAADLPPDEFMRLVDAGRSAALEAITAEVLAAL